MKITLTPINVRIEALQQKLIIYTSGCITGDGGGAVDSVNGQTGVVVLDATDIAEGTNANYVSDAEKTVIGNTSGTNTGDQVGDGSTITGAGTPADPFVSVASGGGGGFQTLTDASPTLWDVSNGYTAIWTLGANRVFPTVSNHNAGDKLFIYIISAGFTVDFTGLLTSGGVIGDLSASVGAIDLIECHVVEISAVKYLVIDNFLQDIQTI